MLTKNFYSIMYSLMTKTNASPFKVLSGETFQGGFSSSYTSYVVGPISHMKYYQPAPSGASVGVMFGSGRTKPTVDDFVLEEPISAGFTVAQPSAVTVNRTALYEEYVVTFGVTATEAVTIGEIGLTGCCVPNDGGSYINYLADRTVLDEPITLAAGESKQITYAIRFNYPVSE